MPILQEYIGIGEEGDMSSSGKGMVISNSSMDEVNILKEWYYMRIMI
jgi:hypothetical protein